MTAGNDAHGRHSLSNIVQIYPKSEHLIIRMRPELNILVPLNLFAATTPLKVQFGVMEFNIGSKQVFSDVYERAGAGKGPVIVVMIHRRIQSPQPRIIGTVVGL